MTIIGSISADFSCLSSHKNGARAGFAEILPKKRFSASKMVFFRRKKVRKNPDKFV